MAKPYEKRLYWNGIKYRYKQSSLKERSKLLDELCDLTGMNRKYLIRKLNSKPKKISKRGAKPRYEPKIFMPILKRIWFNADQPCSKLLKSILADWLPHYEQEYGELAVDIRQRLLQISPATIDRILKKVRVRHKGKGLSGTKPGSLIKNQIPIKTNQWEESKPGFMEADTVAHCGSSLEGDFVWSLTMTDILTAWTEIRATWNKGAHGVAEQIDNIEKNLPFELKGFDCDNGSEFLNYHLIRQFAERPKDKAIQFTRSRPYKKNDNAHVEQKNWTHVRQLFGYHRFSDFRLVALMNDLYANEWSLYQNHFIPSMKCIKKIKVNSRYKKQFDSPKTPYQRIQECNDIDENKKEELQELHQQLNPFELKKQINKKLKKIFAFVSLNNKPRTKI